MRSRDAEAVVPAASFGNAGDTPAATGTSAAARRRSQHARRMRVEAGTGARSGSLRSKGSLIRDRDCPPALWVQSTGVPQMALKRRTRRRRNNCAGRLGRYLRRGLRPNNPD